jgi:alpha-L-fucosidase
VGAAGRSANLLLNVGPMPTGEIQAEFQTRLREVGQWLQWYGPSIYGTRGGPVPPRPWGVTTQSGDRVYVHVLDWADDDLSLPPLPRRVQTATVFFGGTALPFREGPSGVTITLPPRHPEDVDLVIALDLVPTPAAVPARRP